MTVRGTAQRRTVPAVAALPLVAVLAVAGCATMRPELSPPAPATLAAVRALIPHPCNATTAAALDALGVAPGDLRSIYYDRRVTGTESASLQGYDAWIGLGRGPGELVVRHNSSCAFMTSYARGGLRLERAGAGP
jgi:hypothetical protein